MQPSIGSHLPVTDEEVRTGNPDETIRRASVLPGQLKDSVASHNLFLAAPAAPKASGQSAKQLSRTKGVRSTRSPLAPKRPAGQVQDVDTPEVGNLM